MSAEVVKKLRIAGGQRVLVLNASEAQKSLVSDLPGDARMVDTGEADAVVLFARDSSELIEHVRRAVEAAPMQVGRMVDLAKFLYKQGRVEESEQTFQAAEKLAPNEPRLLYQRAEMYIKAGRKLDTARELLRRYVSATNLSPDDPSRYDAEKLLQKAGS